MRASPWRRKASPCGPSGVPLAFLGAVTLRLPVEQVVLLITLEEIVKCVIALFRLRSNRWLHEVAIGMGEKSRAE